MIPPEIDPLAFTIVHSPCLPDPAVVHEAASVLDAQEQAQGARFKFERDSRRFLWRRVVRRRVLADVLGMDGADLAFVSECPRCGSTDHGKPRLAGAPHLHFSASQSGGTTVVALGPEPLGVDVQAVSDDLQALGPSVFSPREQAALAASGKLANERRMLLWARKEACLKAVGDGLAIDPGTVDVLGRGFQDGAFHPVERLGQVVASWRLDDGAALALACTKARAVKFTAMEQGCITQSALHPAKQGARGTSPSP